MSIVIENIDEDQIASTKYYNYRSTEIGRLPSGKNADGHSAQANYLMSSNGFISTTSDEKHTDLKSFDTESYQVSWGQMIDDRYMCGCGSDGDVQLVMTGRIYGSVTRPSRGEKKSFSQNSNAINWGTQAADSQFERNASCSDGTVLMDQGGWEGSTWKSNKSLTLTNFASDSTSTLISNTFWTSNYRIYPSSVSDGTNALLFGGYYTSMYSSSYSTHSYSEIRSFASTSKSVRHAKFGRAYRACGGSNGVSAMRCGGTTYSGGSGYSYNLSTCDICSFSSDAESTTAGSLAVGRANISSGSDGINLLIGGGNSNQTEKKGFDNQNSVLYGSLQIKRNYGVSSSGG